MKDAQLAELDDQLEIWFSVFNNSTCYVLSILILFHEKL